MPKFLTIKMPLVPIIVGIAIGALLVSGDTTLMLTAGVLLGAMLLIEVLHRLLAPLLLLATFVMANRSELWPPDVAPVMPWVWAGGLVVVLAGALPLLMAGWEAHVGTQRREGIEKVEKQTQEERKIR